MRFKATAADQKEDFAERVETGLDICWMAKSIKVWEGAAKGSDYCTGKIRPPGPEC